MLQNSTSLHRVPIRYISSQIKYNCTSIPICRGRYIKSPKIIKIKINLKLQQQQTQK